MLPVVPLIEDGWGGGGGKSTWVIENDNMKKMKMNVMFSDDQIARKFNFMNNKYMYSVTLIII